MNAKTGAVKGVKKTAKKTAAKSKVASSKKPGISDEHRYHMIAEAAYYRAEKRGFDGGDTLHDWYEASNEIDKALQLQ
jgi:hypothetical protein